MQTIKRVLKFSLLLASGWSALAAQLSPDFKLKQTEVDFYPKDSAQIIAICKVEAVFIDHRKFGFFQVKLLPILVVQGVSIELGEAYADNECAWIRELDSNLLLSELKKQAVEWHEVDLTSSGTNSPHLHAQSVRLTDGKGPVICWLENCVIESRGERWHTAKATWQMTGSRQQLIWRTDAGISMHWDLSTGEIAANN
jgi:hypothetical protein